MTRPTHQTAHPINPAHSRRDLLTASAALGATTIVSSIATPRAHAADNDNANSAPKRALRLAHLTDIHVQPELEADIGMATCLRHVQAQDDPPQLILFGGDCVRDVFDTDAARAKVQADTWRSVLRGECSLPYRSALGNHDIWGWNKSRSKTTGNEKRWGKAWGTDLLELDKPYYSFDQAGWHFVVLDSTYPRGDGYVARLDDEQFDWLENDLTATPREMPTLILSHIPILAAAAFFDGDNETSGDWQVPGAWMHIDARRIKDLFLKHPNVKLALSGHLHLIDQVRYNEVTYCCNGAVCAGWWKGPNQECQTGYGLVDLYVDGTFHNQYVTYAWKPRT